MDSAVATTVVLRAATSDGSDSGSQLTVAKLGQTIGLRRVARAEAKATVFAIPW